MKRKTAFLGLFLALALICSYVETLIPIHFSVPGIKLGLTNIVVVLMLYLIGWKEAIVVSVLRIVLSGFMFGNVFAIVYSLSGAVLSFVVMLAAKKTGRFRVISISVLGGIFHNIGQLLIAAVIVETFSLMYYAPVLLVAGAVTGFLIGLLSDELIRRLGHVFR